MGTSSGTDICKSIHPSPTHPDNYTQATSKPSRKLKFGMEPLNSTNCAHPSLIFLISGFMFLNGIMGGRVEQVKPDIPWSGQTSRHWPHLPKIGENL